MKNLDFYNSLGWKEPYSPNLCCRLEGTSWPQPVLWVGRNLMAPTCAVGWHHCLGWQLLVVLCSLRGAHWGSDCSRWRRGPGW